MKRIKTIFLCGTTALAALCAASCNRDEMVDVVSLGAREKVLVEPQTPGADTLKLLTNVPYEARILDGGDWLMLGGEGMMPSWRKEIPFRFEANHGYRRMALLTLTASTRVDSVFIMQEGPLEDRVYISRKTFDVPATGGEFSTEVECFRHPDSLAVSVSSTAVQAKCIAGRLDVTVKPTRSRDPRSFTVTVYYLDGWGEKASDTATFNQKAIK